MSLYEMDAALRRERAIEAHRLRRRWTTASVEALRVLEIASASAMCRGRRKVHLASWTGSEW